MPPFHTRKLAHMQPSEIAAHYNALMSSCTTVPLGHTTWSPYPLTLDQEIRLGDLCLHRNGSFLPLMNANGHEGKSPGFQALPLAGVVPDEDGLTGDNPVEPNVPLLSSGLVHNGSGTENSTTTFYFHNTKAHSAFLIPLGPVVREHISKDKLPPWKKHFEEHHPAWLDHASHHLVNLAFRPTELFLVTGWVKTTHWVVGLVEGRGEFSVIVDKVGNLDHPLFDVSVEVEGGAEGPEVVVKSGPGVQEAIRDEFYQRRARANQFLFLRGFFIVDGVFGRRARDATEPRTRIFPLSSSTFKLPTTDEGLETKRKKAGSGSSVTGTIDSTSTTTP